MPRTPHQTAQEKQRLTLLQYTTPVNRLTQIKYKIKNNFIIKKLFLPFELMLERVALLLLLLAVVGAASLEIEVDDPVGAAAVKAAAEAEASRGFAGTFSTLQRPPELATSRTQKNMTSLTHATKPPI